MRSRTILPAVLFACVATAAAAQPDYEAEGGASWYGEQFHGRKTASGERFDMHLISAAHRTLPLGSMVEVTNLDNDKTIQVRVNDRGPYKGSRIIDLSREAANQLGFRQKGLARVRVKYVGKALPDGMRPMIMADTAMMVTESAATGSGPETAPATATEEAASMIAAALEPAAVEAAAAVTGPYAVQAGAFSKRANADRVAAALGTVGTVEIRPLELRGLTLHRVLVGAFADKAAAQAAVADVESAGFGEAQVVRAR